jgi:ribosome-binding factor A
MKNQETPRQLKINTVIQHEIAYLIQDAIRKSGVPNLMVSVTKVKVVPDISMAKIYISVFPKDKVEMYIENLKTNKNQLRHDLSQKLKSQLRKVPELNFYLDESLDYIEKIDKELINGENPLKKLSSLEPRQKR